MTTKEDSSLVKQLANKTQELMRKITNNPQIKEAKNEETIYIAFGSKSGNSRFVAKQLSKYFSQCGKSIELVNLGKTNPAELLKQKHLLICVSTHSEGEPPSSAKAFYKYIHKTKDLDLSHLNYAICALGDKSYKHYCKAGKDIDRQLQKLNAKAIIERVDCDSKFKKKAEEWIKDCYEYFENITEKQTIEEEPTPCSLEEKTYHAELSEKYLLNEGSKRKEIFHLVLKTNEEIPFQSGDAIEITPRNPSDLVCEILKHFQWNADSKHYFQETEYSLKEILETKLELTSVQTESLTKLQEKLELTIEVSETEGKDILDFIPENANEIRVQDFIQYLPTIKSRAYSIANSPSSTKKEIHLTIKSIDFTINNRRHKGACTNFLNTESQIGDQFSFTLSTNDLFRLPKEKDTPIIMIANGTGIAPFRAFLQERAAIEAEQNWLIFGEQESAFDFLYGKELAQLFGQGKLNKLDLAFSKDVSKFIHVQDVVKAKSKKLYKWIQKGAHIYICGSYQMAEEVENIITDIIKNESGVSRKKAEKQVHQFKMNERYQEDVY